jgi:diguanylate cyclase (GGDEF)-like protein
MANIGSILIVDDTPVNLQLLKRLLTQQGYDINSATDGTSAIAKAMADLPDLILLDIMMPDMDGFQVCQILKADERLRSVPVIFISALAQLNDKVRAFQVGGVDYISKPYQPEEVLVRVATHLTLRRLQISLEEKNGELEREIRERKRIQDELEKLANTDPLTGLYNRRRFFLLAEDEFQRALRYKHPLSVAVFDLDFFKHVNDAYGHAVGDQALVHVAHLLHSTARGSDIVARYGGEEFVLLLPETDLEAAFLAIDRLRQMIEKTPFQSQGFQLFLTVSAGVADLASQRAAELHPSTSAYYSEDTQRTIMTIQRIEHLSQVLTLADLALYQAKAAGRNQVMVWQQTKPG